MSADAPAALLALLPIGVVGRATPHGHLAAPERLLAARGLVPGPGQ